MALCASLAAPMERTRKPQRPREAALIAVLFLLAAGLSAVTILREIGPQDEGLMLQWAARLADGQWPYRDFWSNYAPGQGLVLAALWKAFGPSLLAWRVLRVLTDALVSVLVYALVRREASRGPALLAWVAAAAAMAWPSTPGPNPSALALIFGALLLARRRPLVAGALCGLAIAFRPELGCAGALAVALAGGGLGALAAAAGVGVLALAPFFVVAPGDMWDDLVGFIGIQDLQRLPLPIDYDGPADPNKLLEFYFPVILLAGAAAWALRLRALWLAPLVVAGVLYLLGRPDEFHLVPLSVFLAVGLGLAAAGERRRSIAVVLFALLGLIALHGIERRAGQLRNPPALAEVPAPASDGVKTTEADARALARLLPRVHALAPAGQPIFVAPPRFDRIRLGDTLLYVIADRPNPTRYDVMQPGVVTTAKVQREIVRDLQRSRPPVVVRWLDERAVATEPNGSGRSSRVRLLDRWITSHYGGGERFGPYLLLRRRA
jgi:hypothetical protein